MKTSLKVIALLLAAGVPSAALAATIDASIPVLANVEFAVIAFTVAFFALMVVSDYTRRSRNRTFSTRAPVAARGASHERHRLAA